MKTLLMAFALALLASAPAYAGDISGGRIPRPGETVFVEGGSGTLMPDGSVMGPLCPPSICPNPDSPTIEQDQQKDAFSAFGSMKLETIEVTDSNGHTLKHQAEFTRDANGKITGGKISFDTGNSCTMPFDIKMLAGKTEPYIAGFLADIAKNKDKYDPKLLAALNIPVDEEKKDDEKKGDDKAKPDEVASAGDDPGGDEGFTGFGGNDNEAANAGGIFGDGLAGNDGSTGFDGGTAGTGNGTGNGTGTENAGAVAAGQDGTSKARYGAPVAKGNSSTWASLEHNGPRAYENAEKALKILNAAGVPSADDGTTRCTPTSAGVVAVGCNDLR